MATATRQALTRPALAGAVFAVRELRFWLTDYRRTSSVSGSSPASRTRVSAWPPSAT